MGEGLIFVSKFPMEQGLFFKILVNSNSFFKSRLRKVHSFDFLEKSAPYYTKNVHNLKKRMAIQFLRFEVMNRFLKRFHD